MRDSLRFALSASCLVWLVCGVASSHAGTPKRRADLVVFNGQIRTEDSSDHVVEAIASFHGRIVATGSSAAMRRLAMPGATLVDLHGLTATPGLIDTHAHLAMGGADDLRSVNLSDAKNIAEVRERVLNRARQLTKGQWLLGVGWDEAKLAEQRYITAADLDDLTPGIPVWLEHTTGHYGVANSTALKLAGVDASTADPPAGTIDRSPSGQPSGVLKESAQALVDRLIPAASVQEIRDGILANIRIMNSEGMTGVKDPEIGEPAWEAYAALASGGALNAHICVLWHTDPNLDAARAVLARIKQLPAPPRVAAPNLMSCGLKVFMDGSGGARTAWMHEDWHKRSTEVDQGNRGYPSIDPDVYRQVVREFHAAGVHVGTHAIGDRAIDWVVDTYAQVLAEHPSKGLRHSIIHANTPTDHAIAEMARLQREFDVAYPETQPPFTWWIGDNYAGNLGPGRAQRLNPYATYVSRGIRFGAGSDYPVTPLPARYGLWASVARQTLLGTYGAQPFGLAEAVSADVALRSYTRWAAHQLFLDDEAGSLEVGKSTDLAVWDHDPVAGATNDLKNLRCQLTLFRGRIVYRASPTAVSVRPDPKP